jgi:hypothetical protein
MQNVIFGYRQNVTVVVEKIIMLEQKIIHFMNNLPAGGFKNQGFNIPRKNFEKYGNQFDFIFNTSSVIHLTRSNVFEIFNKSIIQGILSSITWGFPRGVLPGGKSFEPVLNNLEFFEQQIHLILSNGLSNDNFTKLNSIKGVKNGITTKMLYFSNAFVGNSRCLIFDSRVRRYLIENQPLEFTETLNNLPRDSLYPGSVAYVMFCREADTLASKLSIEPDVIEMFLFSDTVS